MNTEIVTINQTASRELVNSSTGKVRGTRYTFGGVETPAELRARLKASGLKGNKLSNAVREVRKGTMAVSFAETQAFMEYTRSIGMAPTYADVTARGATIKLAVLGEDKGSKTSAADKVREELIAKLIANTGASREEILSTLLA